MPRLRIKIEESSGQVSRLENVVFFILIATVFLLPMFFIPSTSFQFQFSKTILVSFSVLVSFGLWLVARLKDGRYPLPNNLVFWISGLILVFGLISTLASSSIGVSFIGQGFEVGTWAFTAVAFIMLFLFAQVPRPKERVFYLYLAFFISALLVALYHALRFVFGADFLSFGIFTDITSNIVGKWTDLGIYFGLVSLLSLITIQLAHVGRVLRTLLWVVFFLSVAFLVIVNSPILWYVFGSFTFLYLVYFYAFEKTFREGASLVDDESEDTENLSIGIPVREVAWKKTHRGSIVAVLLILLSLLFIFDSYNVNHPIGNKIAGWLKISAIELRPNLVSTMDVAQNTLKNRPLFGAGPNQFVGEWLLYKPVGINESGLWNTDFPSGFGLLFTQLVTGGELGFLAWLALIASLFYLALTRLLTPITDKLQRYLSVSSFFASAFLWIFFIVYTPGVVTFSLTFIFTGIFLSSLYNEGLLKAKFVSFTDGPKVGFVSILTFTVLLIAVVALLYVWGSHFVASAYFQRALGMANESNNLEKIETTVLRARTISPSDLYDRFLAEISLIKLGSILRNTPPSANTGQIRAQFESTLGDALRYAREAVAIDETNYLNWMELGRVFEAVVPLPINIQGAYENAQQTYTRALELNPKSPLIHLTLARLERAHSDREKAKSEITAALSLKKNYTEAIYFLSQIQVEEGKLSDAIASVEAVTRLSPDDPTAFFQLGILKYNNHDYGGSIEALQRAVWLAPNYANAKYFLGLSYYKVDRVKDALTQFNDLVASNPGNTEVPLVIKNIQAGKDPFAGLGAQKPEGRDTLPVKENQIEKP